MTQLISSSTSNYHLFGLFIVILVFLNNHQTSANRLSSRSDYQQNSPVYYTDLSYEDADDSESPISIGQNSFYSPDNDETISRNPWSQLFHRQSDRSMYTPKYYSTPKSGFALRHAEIRYIPYISQKRAIPIELQKALFAHGIVGRRR